MPTAAETFSGEMLTGFELSADAFRRSAFGREHARGHEHPRQTASLAHVPTDSAMVAEHELRSKLASSRTRCRERHRGPPEERAVQSRRMTGSRPHARSICSAVRSSYVVQSRVCLWRGIASVKSRCQREFLGFDSLRPLERSSAWHFAVPGVLHSRGRGD